MAGNIGLCGPSFIKWTIYDVENNNGNTTTFWDFNDISDYGSGDIYAWSATVGGAGDQTWWDAFDTGFANNAGTTDVWWMIAFHADEGDGNFDAADRAAVKAVADEIKSLILGVNILVSPMPLHIPKGLCVGSGNDGYFKSVDAVAWALAEGHADQAGPVLTPITTDTWNGPTDPCHQGVGQAPENLPPVSTHGAEALAFAWP